MSRAAMKILYVEDSQTDADLTRAALQRQAPHQRLEIVTSRAAAIQRLEQAGAAYDVVMTDIHLPDGDGISLLTDIRERGWQVAVVIVTGGGDEHTAVAALKAGANDYVLKRDDYLSVLPQTLESASERYCAEVARHARPLRVLYAEDNSADANLTHRHLARHARHIHMDVVHTAAAVLRQLPERGRVSNWDVLLLDYRLPGQDALHVLREISLVRRLDLPVVIVTGQGDEELALQVLRLGAADYVVKNPGYLYQLPSVLENAFHRAQLVREQAALRQSEARYRTLVEQLPAITYTLALDGAATVLYVSPQVESMLGSSPSEVIAHQDLWQTHLHPDDRERVLAALRRPPISGEPLRSEFRMRHRNGRQLWVRNEAALVRGPEGQPLVLQGIMLDISQQRQAEAQIAYQASLLSNIHDAVIATNADGELTAWNRAAENLYGWKADEVLGRPVQEVLPSDITSEQKAAALRALSQIGHCRLEVTQYRRDGNPLAIEGTTIALHDNDGRVTGYVSVNRDISDRRRADAERERLHAQVSRANTRLQALSQRLLDVQEAERRHLARELHDEIGQQLTGLKLLLEMNANPPDLPARSSLAEAQSLLQELMSRVRELSLSLRPAMLDDLGLLPALLWHLERYSGLTGVQVKFQHSGIESRRFPPTIETAAYRIVQEALTNVARHARGGEARVSLWCEADMLHLEVVDSGPGFDPQVAQTAYRSSGLAGMSERATLLGGQFAIESTPGAGTRLRARLPLRANGLGRHP
jgi:PAS domain S-box-containing protein